MPETLSQSIEIPLEIALRFALADLPTAALKLLLVAESARVRGCQDAVVSAKRAQAMTGCRPRDLFGSLARLPQLRAVWLAERERDEDEPFEPFAGVPKSFMDGDEQRILVPYARTWQVAADRDPRRVSIPLDELQRMTHRSALLMRLRAGGALLASKGRLRVEACDLDLLSGYGQGAAPSTHLGAYIEPALVDLAAAAPSVTVELEIARFTVNHRVRRVVLMAKPCTTRRGRAA